MRRHGHTSAYMFAILIFLLPTMHRTRANSCFAIEAKGRFVSAVQRDDPVDEKEAIRIAKAFLIEQDKLPKDYTKIRTTFSTPRDCWVVVFSRQPYRKFGEHKTVYVSLDGKARMGRKGK